MEVESYHDWGGDVTESSSDLLDPVIREIHHACLANPACDVVELRFDGEAESQTVVVNFGDGSFSIDNDVGVRRVERLALSYNQSKEFCWEVRALRKDFPVTIHQNHVVIGEPRALCLYIAPWSSVVRSWTPELFLQRILWWLRATAEGTIHADDQPIEHLFFSSPVTVLLPEGYFDADLTVQKKLSFKFIKHPDLDEQTLIGSYSQNAGMNEQYAPSCVPVSVRLAPIENGPVEEYAGTLGQLQQALETRGSDILEPLKTAIGDITGNDGIEFQKSQAEFVLLILGIPRSRDGTVERTDIQGFIIASEIGSLGESLSVLLTAPGQNVWYRDTLQNGGDDRWKSFLLEPVNVKCFPSEKQIMQFSGLDEELENPNGVLAGVGALGGLLAEIWKRECWGIWSYVDKDIIQPHNVARHIASHCFVGYPKSTIVDGLVSNTHTQGDADNNNHFVSDILSNNDRLMGTIKDSSLLVDATTTLNVPRTVSRKDEFPRTVSVFLTPSGKASVMLFEDESRSIRCGHLEAQYYRAILSNNWGGEHLTGHHGKQWVGGGCREVTLSMSNELIHLHGATLARQVRKAFVCQDAKVCVWELDDDSGALTAHDVPVFPSYSVKLNEWEVIWDDGFLNEAKSLRSSVLPKETGGILFGVIDQKDKTVTMVKACPPPPNSESTASSFIRGAYDSPEMLEDCGDRTAGIVSYVGEWHSHPEGCSALPSQDDVGQLEFVTRELRVEGLPAIMMIVSESSVGFYLDGSGVVID